MGVRFTKETKLLEAKAEIQKFTYDDSISADENVVKFFEFMVKDPKETDAEDEKSYTPESAAKFYKAIALSVHSDKSQVENKGKEEFFKAVGNIMDKDVFGRDDDGKIGFIADEEKMADFLFDNKTYQKPVLDFLDRIPGIEREVKKIKSELRPEGVLSRVWSFVREIIGVIVKSIVNFFTSEAGKNNPGDIPQSTKAPSDNDKPNDSEVFDSGNSPGKQEKVGRQEVDKGVSDDDRPSSTP